MYLPSLNLLQPPLQPQPQATVNDATNEVGNVHIAPCVSANCTPQPPPQPQATAIPSVDLPEADLDGQDVAWLNVTELDDLAKCVNTCVERWKNAGPEARKK